MYVSAQFYIKGDVKDENNDPLQNVKIYLPSTHSIYYSGIAGGFGIPSSQIYDSLILSKEGYITLGLKIKTDVYQSVVLKMAPVKSNTHNQKLVSLTTNGQRTPFPMAIYDGESYSNLVENDFIRTDSDYETIFSMRIDKASYSNVRRFINQNMKVPPDAVRIDEMLNYFNFNYKEPQNNDIFRIESQITECPWNKAHQLLFVNLSAKKLNLEHVPRSNFVFLIDVSGSMDQPNRLPLLKEAFQLLVKNLRRQDTVSIVTYGGTVGIWLQPTSGAEKNIISKSIEELNAAGDTPGEAAIRTAYKLAEATFMKGGNNRIILATDGDFNIGQTSEKELEELIAKEKQGGVYLTCLGVGMGNYKDSKIEILSKKGNGNFAYIDDIREAEKVLVTEFTQTLYSVASDVYVTIKFNPVLVKEYRLIGYDNKKNILAESGNELEGGEVGSGSGNTVLFEIVSSTVDSSHGIDSNFAQLSVHCRIPGDSSEKLNKYKIIYNFVPFGELNKSLQFAASVAMFGLKIRQSKYIPDIDFDTIKDIAQMSLSKGNYLQTEFVQLLDKSKQIYHEKKKRKKRRIRNEEL